MVKHIYLNQVKTSGNFFLIILWTLTFVCLVFLTGNAQNNGDFRSKESGSWKDKQTWEKYDNGSWENTNSAPGNEPEATITIRQGHTVEFDASSAQVLNLIVENGGQLYRNSTSNEKSLGISGNIECNGTIGDGPNADLLSLEVSGESTTISGNGQCSLYSISKNSNTFSQSELVFDMAVQLTVTSGNAIYNTKNNTNLNIVINPGASLTTHAPIDLKNGNTNKTCSLYLKSNESDYGSLITPAVDNSDTSNTTVELYLSQNEWHYVCSPVDDPLAGTFLNIYLMQFNEPSGQWTYIVDPNFVLSKDMQGLAAWSSTSLLGNTTVQYQGTLNTGYHEIPLTYTENATHNNRGFNFVGNPYCSAIDWDYSGNEGWTKTNVDNAIYMWNSNKGAYGCYVNGLSVNGASSIIPAHQGFYVHCTQATGVLGVDYNAQVQDHEISYKSQNETGDNLLRLRATGNGYNDETLIHFEEQTTSAYDAAYDAYKMKGLDEAPQIFSYSDGNDELAINSLPATALVELGFTCGLPGIYSINWEGQSGFGSDTQIFLEDLVTGQMIDLQKVQEYNFSYQTDDDIHRFNIHFYGPNAIAKNEIQKVNIYAYKDEILIQNKIFDNAIVTVYNLLGQPVAEDRISKGYTSIRLEKEANYIVTVVSGNYIQTNKVFVR